MVKLSKSLFLSPLNIEILLIVTCATYVVVVEYAELGSLYEYLRAKSIEFNQILQWAKEIALGKKTLVLGLLWRGLSWGCYGEPVNLVTVYFVRYELSPL